MQWLTRFATTVRAKLAGWDKANSRPDVCDCASLSCSVPEYDERLFVSRRRDQDVAESRDGVHSAPPDWAAIDRRESMPSLPKRCASALNVVPCPQ